jgi:hypothetical protein
VHLKKGSNVKFSHKIAATFAALALVVGAVPAGITAAHAVETGQRWDKKRFPRTIHIVILLSVAAITAAVLLANDDDQPTSP